MSHTKHIGRILDLNIAQQHISIHIYLQTRIGDLIEEYERLFIIAISIITDTYQEFVEERVMCIKISKPEKIVLCRLSIVHKEISVGQNLIRKDVRLILSYGVKRKPFGKREISIFEQSKRNQTIPIIGWRGFYLSVIR